MVHVLDTKQLGFSGIVAATVLESSDGLIVFDTGPESTFNHVLAELSRIGFSGKDVRHVFLSHIHFDHAGAAWRLADLGATIYVHPKGAPHLIDPTKLIASAERIFGAEMEKLWGQIAAVPKDRIRILSDRDIVHFEQFDVQAVETPGHAAHHHVYVWEDNLFGGDIAGVRLGNGPPIPPFVPPELHVESWLQSLDKIRTINPARLYLPHFGLAEGSIPAHLDAMEERVRRWSEWFLKKIRASADEEQLISEFTNYEHAELFAGGANAQLVEHYEAADPSYMAVPAMLRYWRKYHPEHVEK